MLERFMNMTWGLSRQVRVESIRINNVFLFHFGTRDDRQRVLMGGPWLFERQLLSLIKPSGIGDVSEMIFNIVIF